jgi:hypothetical protein
MNMLKDAINIWQNKQTRNQVIYLNFRVIIPIVSMITLLFIVFFSKEQKEAITITNILLTTIALAIIAPVLTTLIVLEQKVLEESNSNNVLY